MSGAVAGVEAGAGRRRGIAVLGSTGSIGTATLRVLARHADQFALRAITAHRNVSLLAEQVAEFSPRYVGLTGERSAAAGGVDWQTGADVLLDAAIRPDVEIVVNAVVGAAGLDVTLAALQSGRRVALANKETLVMAGPLVRAAARTGCGELVPVDSEHSAILQCIAGRPAQAVRRLIITASGGPFRSWTPDQIARATIADALQHPTWSMGRKITVDSATLANKALEVIEAHELFDVAYDRIDVVVHPQSVVHSMVEFVDGSVLAQLGAPSMEVPILYALTHPARVADATLPPFDPVAYGRLEFEPVRRDAFPMLDLGIAAGRAGGAAPAVYNAANEAAVAGFLDGRLAFGAIPKVVALALDALGSHSGRTLDDLRAADAAARRLVSAALAR